MSRLRSCRNLEPVEPQTPPVLLGVVLDLILLGILTVQLYVYYLSFPKDKRLVKFAVFWIYLVGIAQTALALWDVYNFAVIIDCGHRTIAAHFWFSCIVSSAIVALTVQLFYAYRIRVILQNSWTHVLIISCSLGQLVSSILGAICRVGEMNNKSGRDAIAITRSNFCWKGFNPVWGPLNVACDLTITIFMATFLLRHRRRIMKKNLHTQITKMIQIIIETGMATSTVVIVYTVLLNMTEPRFEVWCLLPALIMGKIYSNSMLALLNNRVTIVDGRNYTDLIEADEVRTEIIESNDDSTRTGSSGMMHLFWRRRQ